ncbi:PH domain-containing protein [Streptomyces galilaeus]|uniref:PH domain-containing protein n=1 Tax=Streptomyces galilaeus TaxID=33899 RepID=UPI0038F64626
MPEIWISLDASDRRSTWVWTGFLTFVWAAVAAAIMLTTGPESPGAERRLLAGLISAFWLAGVFHLANRAYGRTLLTPERIEFRTFVSRRSIPWSEITGIEKKGHQTRGGAWWELRAHRVRGRSVAIPGTFSSREAGVGFERKLAVLRKHWTVSREANVLAGGGITGDVSGMAGDAGAEGETVGEVGDRLRRKPRLIVAVLAVAAITAVIGVVALPVPFQVLPSSLVGVPVMVWLIHRDRRNTPG